MKRTTPEGHVKASILHYLQVKKIFAIRMNSGYIPLEGKNGRRMINLHEPGTADILAIIPEPYDCPQLLFMPTWIEAKAPNGKQSDLQKQFQEKVEAEGHVYILAFGIEDLEKAGL